MPTASPPGPPPVPHVVHAPPLPPPPRPLVGWSWLEPATLPGQAALVAVVAGAVATDLAVRSGWAGIGGALLVVALAAGLIAFGAGWLISSLLPATQREQQLAGQAKDAAQENLQPIAQQVATEVKENLQPVAQQAVESVKATAQDAGQTVFEEGRSATQDVQGRAQDAADNVRGSATSS